MGSCWPRWWLRAVNVALLASALQPAAPIPVAECMIDADPERRVYQLVDFGTRRDPQWWLTLRSQSLGDRVVELPLPDAQIERGADRLRLTSASKNGGLAVDLVAEPEASRLEVIVNFELEVNVYRDLSPEVERMNTESAASMRCRVLRVW
jgi:hypothetical protein